MSVPNVPHELVEQIINGNCVAFIGAGLSRGAGFPDWPGLLNQMIGWASRYGVEVEDRSELEYLISEKDYLTVAEELYERFSKDEFRRFMDSIFRNPSITPRKTHSWLFEIPFAAYLTTNYDTLLEAAYVSVRGSQPKVFTHDNYPALSAAGRDSTLYILKVHGTIDQIETIILGRTGYRELMHNNSACRTYLQNIFTQKTILFLGFGLSDPHLMLILEASQAIYKGYTGNHFALVAANALTHVQQKRFKRDYNIRILPYTPATGDHHEVAAFLESLAKTVREERSTGDRAAIKKDASQIIGDLIDWLRTAADVMSQLEVAVPNSPAHLEASQQPWWGRRDLVDINFESVDEVSLLIDEYNALPRGVGSAAMRQRLLDEKQVLNMIRTAILSLRKGIQYAK